ncbi:hypothetical protein NQ315_002703 [Exocentrus adspersus]|uniref:Uncharacterized protein n=1 Tax=Exocentrus adspersus TaxID=1586481 RepID=A0AAV8VI82_9CUCU|nr:hypothetical protein NQ315_002703 [Exocentrus adspersus]
MACVALHNFIQGEEETLPENQRKYCPAGYTDAELPDGTVRPGSWRELAGLKSVRRTGANNSSLSAMNNRNLLRDYVNSAEGSVSWQLNHVLEGAVPSSFCYNP